MRLSSALRQHSLSGREIEISFIITLLKKTSMRKAPPIEQQLEGCSDQPGLGGTVRAITNLATLLVAQKVQKGQK